jgi:hypothetical protein
MSPRNFSAIVLRLLAVWFLVEGLLSAVDVVLIHRELMLGMAGVHRRLYQGSTPLVFSTGGNMYLHDIYYLVSQSNPALVPTALRLVGSMVLWFGSKPMARYLTRDLDSHAASREP